MWSGLPTGLFDDIAEDEQEGTAEQAWDGNWTVGRPGPEAQGSQSGRLGWAV